MGRERKERKKGRQEKRSKDSILGTLKIHRQKRLAKTIMW